MAPPRVAKPPVAQPRGAASGGETPSSAAAGAASGGAASGGAARTDTTLSLPSRRYLRWEIFTVFAISLGASGVNALLSLIGSLLAKQSLSSQQALLVGSLSPNHWFDLVLQLVGIAEALTPVVLVLYLMARSGEPPSVMGLDAKASQAGTWPAEQLSRR